jgi:photosystem II stability/assembly factor-like uncharacterized protein
MVTNFLRLVVSLAATLGLTFVPLVVGGAEAPSIPASLYSGMHWRNVGPFRAGRALAVAGVPGDPERFYFGAAGGGVWTSGNAGRTWSPLFDKEPVSSIGAIAVAPSDPRTIYVGSGEADMRSDIIGGNGMYKSVDAGATWTRIGLEGTRAIGRILVDPHDRNIVYVAALGHPYAPSAERGVFATRDGGTTWRRILFHDADTGAIDLAFGDAGAHTLFASLWQTRRPPWNIYPPSNGPGSGLYESSDAGTTWTHLRGLPVEKLGKIGIAVAPSAPQRVYAIVDAKRGGLYRSDDGGASWRLVDDEKRIWGRGWYFCHVTVDPKNADRVYVSNTSLYRSDDGGATFTAIKGAPGGDDYHMLWVDPLAPERMILASDQGAIVSVDNAHSWSSWYNQPTAQIYHVATDDAFPYRIYGAQQDSGALETLSRSSRRGISERDWSPLNVGGESDYMAPDPLHPGIVFGGRVDREDLATRVTRSVTPSQQTVSRVTWTLPLVFSAADPRRLYFSHERIYETTDEGASWRTISPDLSRLRPGVPKNLDAPTIADNEGGVRRGVVYTLGPSPLDAGLLWAGTDDGTVHVTRDDGAHWSDVTPHGLEAWSKITLIEPSHFEAGTAYAAIDRHRLDDDAPAIFRTRDYGATWTRIAAGIPDGSFVNAIREDPERRGLLYAGTETGVYVSFDDGDAWQSLQLNMPVCSVRDLTIRHGDLAIATHGRSFWVLDDLAPLRQASAAAAARGATLYAPQPAVRVRPGDDEGTPLPPEEPQGENPPAGAPLDYVLNAVPKTPVVITVADALGHTVRRYASDDVSKPVDAATLDIPAFWVVPVLPPPATLGMHRTMWDFMDDAGTMVPPGRYTIGLTVDGKVMVQSLELRRDPRESVTDDDLRAQYALASDVALLRARVVKAIASATKQAAPQSEIEALEGSRDALVDFSTALESGDARPTPEQVRTYAVLGGRARALLGANR